MATRQMLSQKKGRKLAKLAGLEGYLAAYMNGDLPHGVAVVWTDAKNAYFVRVRRNGSGITRQFVKDTKKVLSNCFRVHRFIPEESPRYCGKCGLDVRGLEHTPNSCELWEQVRSGVEQGTMVENNDFLFKLVEDKWVRV